MSIFNKYISGWGFQAIWVQEFLKGGNENIIIMYDEQTF